ncbi:DUF433 domain-containing protein [Bradyrhizobium sp.]|uniref:DUF433 domain-containing protein n=1 Tax=Bradyrhizobium sp. TaxID=376 RepID=UPI0035223E0D
MKQPIISSSREIMGGAAVSRGTRVPVQTLLDYREGVDFGTVVTCASERNAGARTSGTQIWMDAVLADAAVRDARELLHERASARTPRQFSPLVTCNLYE